MFSKKVHSFIVRKAACRQIKNRKKFNGLKKRKKKTEKFLKQFSKNQFSFLNKNANINSIEKWQISLFATKDWNNALDNRSNQKFPFKVSNQLFIVTRIGANSKR